MNSPIRLPISNFGKGLRLVTRPARYLFVLGHQRSYSTVLSHILGSSPEIAGYMENRLGYRRVGDVLRLKFRLANSFPEKKPKYFLDKILHTIYPLDCSYLNRLPARVVFIMRQPDRMMRSNLNMLKIVRGKGSSLCEADVKMTVEHYTERLRTLVDYSSRLTIPKIFIESERIIADSATVLQELTDFLELKEPLTPSYEHFAFTGKGGYGDPSQVIRNKFIVKERQDYSFEGIDFPDLEDFYQETLESLRFYCC